VNPSPRDLSETDGANLEQLAIVSVLCNEADLHQRDEQWIWRGDPTDVALLSMAHKTGLVVGGRAPLLDERPQINRIPFEPEHRFAASFHQFDGEVRALVKGAPERVLSMCIADRDDDALLRAKTAANDMAANGLRVLAFAEGKISGLLDPSMAPPPPQNLLFLGLVGMIDPLRAGARQAVATCEQAGIGVCMVTGDHPTTALAIARDLGIAQQRDQVITGETFENLSDHEVRAGLRVSRLSRPGLPVRRTGLPSSPVSRRTRNSASSKPRATRVSSSPSPAMAPTMRLPSRPPTSASPWAAAAPMWRVTLPIWSSPMTTSPRLCGVSSEGASPTTTSAR
jgi:magnesium-transporting ATPase (P-type)